MSFILIYKLYKYLKHIWINTFYRYQQEFKFSVHYLCMSVFSKLPKISALHIIFHMEQWREPHTVITTRAAPDAVNNWAAPYKNHRSWTKLCSSSWRLTPVIKNKLEEQSRGSSGIIKPESQCNCTGPVSKRIILTQFSIGLFRQKMREKYKAMWW